MRDILSEVAGEGARTETPEDKARRHARQALPKRFYTTVTVAEADGAHRVLLDGKPVLTPARHALALPTATLAEAVAAEWDAQSAFVDPGTMPLTRLVNSALDGVALDVAAVADEAARYAGSDLLCYRAEGPERFVARQTAAWDPLLAFAEHRFGVRLRLAEGVMPVEQDPGVIAAVRAAMPDDPLVLAGLSAVTTLTGSVLIAFTLLDGRLTADEAWGAAHLDEDWNVELWGEDQEAADRRVRRRAEFDAAVRLMVG